MENIIVIIFIASLLLAGTFYEYLSCAVSTLYLIWLLLYMKKHEKLRIKKNMTSIFLLVMIFFYILSVIWAVDSGMAAFGIVKFLPVPLFAVAIMQEPQIKEKIKNLLPYVAAVVTVISFVGMKIPKTEALFSVAGRLAGCFQYPNTYALFLLVSGILLLGKENFKKTDILVGTVLVVGLFLTGSRTVFVLAIISITVVLVIGKKPTRKWAVIAMAVVIGLLVTNGEIISRFTQFSLHESTLVGRLLYYQDALPVILKQPLGLGYMGYYYMQQSIQTGLYSVLHIHNDFLQILLDIGWIPFVTFVVAIIKSLFGKTMSKTDKLILAVICIHSFLDFDLQFVSMFCLVILFMDLQDGKEIEFPKKIVVLAGIVLMVLNIYLGSVSALVQMEQRELVHNIYPWHTQNNISRLTETDDVEEMNQIADEILNQNEYVAIAYSAKARYAYSKGDFANLIQYKNKVFEIAPFQYEEYEEYCYMLINGIMLYEQMGDVGSIQVCQQELLATEDKLHALRDRMSEYGKLIKDQPVMELPDEIRKYIHSGGE